MSLCFCFIRFLKRNMSSTKRRHNTAVNVLPSVSVFQLNYTSVFIKWTGVKQFSFNKFTTIRKKHNFLCVQQQAAHCGCDKFKSWMSCWIKDMITFLMHFALVFIHVCVILNNIRTWTVTAEHFPFVIGCDRIGGGGDLSQPQYAAVQIRVL